MIGEGYCVQNLGVVFDSNFTFSDRVSQVIKSTRVHARDLYRICPFLDHKTSVLLANALVSSRLDDCNSLFLSLTDFELRRLQLVQNSLCRVVTCPSKFSHITPQLKKLHWLPVKYRVQFKIGLITYKILNQGQPIFLRGLIHPYTSSRNTRRSTPKLKFLHTPTFGCRVYKSNTFLILLVTTPSGVITSGDIADSPVMKKMDDNRGLMIIRDASHKHIQPLTLAYF